MELDAFEKNVEKSPNLTFDGIEKSSIHLNVGNMSPGVSNIMQGISFSNHNKIGYNIFIFARNSSFTEELRMQNVKGVWRSAIRVMRNNYSDENPNSPPKIVLERIHPDFPRNKDGEVDWE